VQRWPTSRERGECSRVRAASAPLVGTVEWCARRRGIIVSEVTSAPDVTGVRVLARYVVELTFDDGARRVIDLKPFLWGEAFEAILGDYDEFLKVAVDLGTGTIVWPNGADISPRTLYEESKPAIPA